MSPEAIPSLKKKNVVWDAVVNNWKTTGCGLLSGLAAFVVANPAMFPEALHLPAMLVTSGALAALGICAKDSNKSHTQQ